MRYVIALVVAGLMIAAAATFCAFAKHALHNHIRQELRKNEENDPRVAEWEKMLDQGTLPPDFGVEVPGWLAVTIGVADLLFNLRYVGIILAVGVCFAVAYLVPGRIDSGHDRDGMQDQSPDPK